MNKKLVVVVIMMATLTIILGTGTGTMGFASSSYDPQPKLSKEREEAPVAISGSNVYVAWFTNESTVNSNFEVGFRASSDGGVTFGPITNLSNTDNSDSINTNIAAENEYVIVSWWERNQTSMLPVARISTDDGRTFGPRLNITANAFGTIGGIKGELE
jgi:hypothetical protein